MAPANCRENRTALSRFRHPAILVSTLLIFQTGDAGTVIGYRRIDLIQRIRDEVQRNLETDEAAIFLQKMCHRRLLPTPWLNKVHRIHHLLSIQHRTEAVSQDFREPLYLRDVPVTIEDRRSEEQIKYPEFFQHVLSS